MTEHLNIPTILVIFGATGDLTSRKLLPALYNLDRQGLLPDSCEIVAFARRDYTDSSFRDYAEEAVKQYANGMYEQSSWKRFAKRITYARGDFNDDEAYAALADKLNSIDTRLGVCTHKILYLAISPDLYEQVFEGIRHTQMKQICGNIKDTRLVIEKPFGRDRQSFDELSSFVTSVFEERQIYRIDHYLGKETVQNLLYFKAGNPVFISDWSQKRIDRIEVVAHETLGVEGRGSYYDSYGHLRDMVQSHILQLLALVLIDIPSDFDTDAIRHAKAEAISSLRIASPEDDVIRGQYAAGVIEGSAVPGYLDEQGIPQDSDTETMVRLHANVEGGRWDGLDVVISSGKRMAEKRTELILHYKPMEEVAGLTGENRLIFRIQPKEGISLEMKVKKPTHAKLETVTMDFEYKSQFTNMLPDAYEKILLDVIRLNRNLFLSAEELAAAWDFIDPVMRYWKEKNPELIRYPAGTNAVS
ncbi:MAG: Glucose-6-phosphate 1-dehydrogenase [candidate division WS6 bacterium OLB20]|uniref:Glucose-6-phosphate 1-dehydrogenase n=1 Tax=candidate division WS6 bacterium OLB20 TaxID=1617426 RepID=A0A136LVP4_9BACT|nr:MAG: Glucose-6-phosphate 1-dehydrogenase [candidate division WS6 bacterium OLB20]